MGSGILFPISAIPFILIVTFNFISKKNISSIETKIYKFLLFLNLTGLILEILCTYAAYISVTYPIISDFILKSYLVYNILFIFTLAYYVYYISYSNDNSKAKMAKNKQIKNIFKILTFIIVFVIYTLKCDLIIKDNFKIRYTTGPSVFFCYSIGLATIIYMLLVSLKNANSLKIKKFIPIYLFISTLILGVIIQMNYQSVLIMTYIETLSISVMYFTIENPDVKMVDELIKNKQLVESSFEDKSIYLFNLTQQVKEPINRINALLKKFKETNKKEEKENLMYKMEENYNNLNFIINNVMDISNIDYNNIKVFKGTYEPSKFFLDIKKKTEQLLKNKENIQLYYHYNKTIPNELYGDTVKLKQVMMSLIDNAIKFTEQGTIDINIDGIHRYDSCRLIITIKDTGKGMSLAKVNEILVSNDDLTKEDIEKLDNINIDLKPAIKIIKMIGGIINIKSDINYGTEIIVILDQRVDINKKTDLVENLNFSNNAFGNKKVLIVSNDSVEINRITKLLSKNDINTSMAIYGKECVSKIRTGEKYNLIIMNDEMKPDNALPTLKKLKEIKNFKIPVVVMLEKEKEFIKEHYLNDGFKDYIIKDNLEKEMERIIDKYL